MRRSLAACVALLLGCNPAPSGSGKDAPAKTADAKKTPAKTDVTPKADVKADTKTDATPKVDAKVDTKPEAPPKVETPPPEPAEPPIVLSATTTALLDRLVPAAERVKVDEAAAKPLEIQSIEGELWVVEGARRASLHRRASKVLGTTPQKDASGEPVLHVGFEDDAFCGDIAAQYVDYSARTLLARLERASGVEHHGKREFEAAAKRLAQAALLDPSLDEPWLELAAALAKHEDTAAAMAALEPMLGRAPLLTYHHVLSSADLAALREQPVIVALRAPKAGDVKLKKMTLAYSAHHSLVAVVRTEQSWGACNYVQELRLYGSKTGEQVLSVPLAGMGETDPDCEGSDRKVLKAHRKVVDARFAAAERFLRDLGFSASPELELVRAPKDAEGEGLTLELPKAGLQLGLDTEKVWVRKGTEVLVERPQTLASGVLLVGHDPTAGVAFIEWYAQVPEGCAFDEDGAGYYVFPVPASP